MPNGFRSALGLGIALTFCGVVVAQAAENLIKNGDFEGGNTDPWSVYGKATLKLDTTEKYAGKASGYVDVSEKGANFWDSGFQYLNIEFEANTQYTYAAFVKAEAPKQINFKPELSADPWTAYGEKMMDVTTTWKEYYVEFKPAVKVTPAALTLHIAADDGNFWIDNARWYIGTYEPGNLPTPVDPKEKTATTWAALKSR
jgi:hypothetical protein